MRLRRRRFLFLLLAVVILTSRLFRPANAQPEQSIDVRVASLAVVRQFGTSHSAERINESIAERSNIALSRNRVAYVNRNGDLIARNLDSHRPLWIVRRAVRASEAPLAANADQIFSVTKPSVVASFEARSGLKQWETPLPGKDTNLNTIVTAGRFIYVHGTNIVAKLDATSGQIVWSNAELLFVRNVAFGPDNVNVQVCECGGPPLSSVIETYSARTGKRLSELGADADAKFLIARPDGSAFIGLTDRFGIIANSAAVEIATLDGRSGRVRQIRSYRPDSKWLDPDTPPPADIFVTSAYTVIRLRVLVASSLGIASVIYVYTNARPPEKQLPLRLGDLGQPIAALGPRVWFLDPRGLSMVRIGEGRVSTSLIAPFDFDPYARNTYVVVGQTFVMATPRGEVVRTDATAVSTRRYDDARCPMIFEAVQNAAHLVVVCGKDFVPQTLLSL